MDKKKILIVDDDYDITEFLEIYLKDSGRYETCAVNQPRMALMTARRFLPDLILLDVMMPEIDGGTLAGEFKNDPKLQNIPIVFLTAIISRYDGNIHKKWMGPYIYLAKPINLPELMQLLAKLLPSKTSF